MFFFFAALSGLSVFFPKSKNPATQPHIIMSITIIPTNAFLFINDLPLQNSRFCFNKILIFSNLTEFPNSRISVLLYHREAIYKTACKNHHLFSISSSPKSVPTAGIKKKLYIFEKSPKVL